MARFFTQAEAERLLAEVEPAIQAAIRLKAEYQSLERQLHNARNRIAMSGGAQLDRGAFLLCKQRRDSIAVEFKTAVDRIQGFGCILKDLDAGLIDFPTRFQGKEVYLCWQLGERGIQFWHGVEEGFRGRKPIDRHFLDNHRGEQSS